MNIYNNSSQTSQDIYDSFNSFIFSSETRVFNKMTKKIEFFNRVRNVVGDIVECGVFKGSGISLWLKLKKMYEPNSNLKVIGLDFFDTEEVINNIEDDFNSDKMKDVLKRVDKEDLKLETVENKLNKIDKDSFILLKGDASVTSKEYIENNPGLKIKILYMDLDLGDPTYKVLKNTWNNISKGGIIVFDEYAYHCWDESVGVDKFLKEIPSDSYTLYNTKIMCPTLYLIKH